MKYRTVAVRNFVTGKPLQAELSPSGPFGGRKFDTRRCSFGVRTFQKLNITIIPGVLFTQI